MEHPFRTVSLFFSINSPRLSAACCFPKYSNYRKFTSTYTVWRVADVLQPQEHFNPCHELLHRQTSIYVSAMFQRSSVMSKSIHRKRPFHRLLNAKVHVWDQNVRLTRKWPLTRGDVVHKQGFQEIKPHIYGVQRADRSRVSCEPVF
jgi:hypothetical protein